MTIGFAFVVELGHLRVGRFRITVGNHLLFWLFCVVLLVCLFCRVVVGLVLCCCFVCCEEAAASAGNLVLCSVLGLLLTRCLVTICLLCVHSFHCFIYFLFSCLGGWPPLAAWLFFVISFLVFSLYLIVCLSLG